MIPTPPTLGEMFAKALVNLPKYLVEWVVGLLYVIITEVTITTFVVTGLIAGLALHSVLIGLLVFFVLYSISRIVYQIAAAIQGGAVRVGDALFHGLTPPRVLEPQEHQSYVLDPTTQLLTPTNP